MMGFKIWIRSKVDLELLSEDSIDISNFSMLSNYFSLLYFDLVIIYNLQKLGKQNLNTFLGKIF